MATAAYAQVHVSGYIGNDTTGTGSAALPFATLQRALQTGVPEVWMEAGDYIINAPVVIPPNVRVLGGYYRSAEENSTFKFIKDTQATNLLVNIQTPEFQVFPRPAAFIVSSGASLQWVTVLGGYYSTELLPGGSAFEVDYGGGVFAAVYARSGVSGQSAVLDRCRIKGGGYGVRVEGTASVFVNETLIENTLSRGLFVLGGGAVAARHCVIQNTESYGVYIQDNSDVLIESCTIRRNASDGIRVVGAAPTIRGSLVQLSGDGISLFNATGASITNCTIVDNRDAGIYVREGLPDFSSNIIAGNAGYGVEEQLLEDVDGGAPPIQGGALDLNLFSGNSRGAYLDEGAFAYSSETDLNTALVNDVLPVANIVADPRFVDTDLGDYRLQGDSPALDLAEKITGYTTDLEANERLVEIDEVGDSGDFAMDLGAYERQTEIITHFGAESVDLKSVPDPFNPGQTGFEYNSPRWRWNTTSPFKSLKGEILPGRLRLSSLENDSYGGMGRTFFDDMEQPADKIAIVTATLEADDNFAVKNPRIRCNDIQNVDVSSSVIVVGRRPMAPTSNGKEYEYVYDLRQGGYRGLTLAEKPSFRQAFTFELMDFYTFPYRSRHDLTNLRVDFVDRTAFNAQYTNTLKSWTFSPSESFDWQAGPPAPPYNQPFLSYDPGRGALRYEVYQNDSFGGWGSPYFNMPAGKRFRVDFKVSTPQAKDVGPYFRIRMNPPFFDVVYEMTIFSVANGNAAPDEDGETYSLYGRVPDAPELIETGNVVPMGLAVDVLGFTSPPRPVNMIMYLEDVTVFTAP